MKKLTLSVMVVGLVLCPGFSMVAAEQSGAGATPPTAEKTALDAVKNRLDNQVTELNGLCENSEVRERVLRAFNAYHGVALRHLETQTKANPELGVAGVLLANLISQQCSRKTLQIIELYKTKKAWSEVVGETSVDFTKLIDSIYRLELVARSVVRSDDPAN